MSTLKNNAEGIALWVREHASPDEIISKMVADDRDALFWHVACMHLPREVVERIEHMATHLVANGFERPTAD